MRAMIAFRVGKVPVVAFLCQGLIFREQLCIADNTEPSVGLYIMTVFQNGEGATLVFQNVLSMAERWLK